MKRPHVAFLANSANLGPGQLLLSITKHVKTSCLVILDSSCRASHPSSFPAEAPDILQQTNCLHYVLSKFLTHKTHECDKELFYATKVIQYIV